MNRAPDLCPSLSSFHPFYKPLNYLPYFTDGETEVHKVIMPWERSKDSNLSPTDSKHPELDHSRTCPFLRPALGLGLLACTGG